jgi:malate dehydrogenase (oxaloacetate-decarboxylating)(NADP+)
VIAAVKAMAPTFGGINLEDIRSPDCFHIEKALQEALDIPVFHDDQHGTAIIATAGLLNALELTERVIEDTRVVFCGAGAAAIATANLLVSIGIQRSNHCQLVPLKSSVKLSSPFEYQKHPSLQ